MSSPVIWHDIKQLVVNKDNHWEDTVSTTILGSHPNLEGTQPRVDGMTSRATNHLYGARPLAPIELAEVAGAHLPWLLLPSRCSAVQGGGMRVQDVTVDIKNMNEVKAIQN